MNTLTVADIVRLSEQVRHDKVRASATGSSDKLSYIIYDDDGNPNYTATLAHALCTIPGISEINKQRILAIYLTSSAGGYDDLYRMIESLRATTNNLASEIKVIEAQLVGVDDAISQINSLKTQLAELQSLYRSLNSSVNSLTEIVSNLETIVDNIDLEALDQNITSNKLRIDNLETDNQDIKDRVTKLEQGGGGSIPGDIPNRVKTLEDKVIAIDTGLTKYDQQFEQVNYDITQAIIKVNNANTAVSNLAGKVDTNTSDISKAKLDINTLTNGLNALTIKVDNIITGGDVDLTNYPTKTEMFNAINSIFSSLRGATIYNLHFIGWHDDIELEFNPETYSDAQTENEYVEQYGMIAAKTITTKEQLLAINVPGNTIIRYIDEIMHVESIEELFANMQAHSILNSVGFGKPKVLDIRLVGGTIYLDTYWNLDEGFLARFELSLSGLKVKKLLDLKELEERITKLEEDNVINKANIATLQTKVSSLESTASNHESRISSLERRVT